MNQGFNEEEIDRLRIMVKNDHVSMGVDGSGEFVFWATEENITKFKREQHLYEEA